MTEQPDITDAEEPGMSHVMAPLTEDGEPAPEAQYILSKPQLSELVSQLMPEEPPQENGRKRNPDYFLSVAKHLVVENYNGHRNDDRFLSPDDIGITSSSWTKFGWQVILESPAIRVMLWKVSFDRQKGETVIEVYKKVNNAKMRQE